MSTTNGHTTVIRATKVIGTRVTNAAGKTIGDIEDIALDKSSNTILFAIVSFGGLLGMGEKFHPIPWRSLSYSEQMGAYVVDVTEEQLRQAPADSIDALTRADGADYRNRAHEFYQVPRNY